jgi:drug/metabolite transporter (DMT)-like permease
MKYNTSTLSTGALLVGLSALGYATNPIFGKFAYMAGATPITLLALRFTMAALGLWVMVALRKESQRLTWTTRAKLLLVGALGMAIVSLLYFTALPHIGASLATGLFYTHPALIAAVSVVRGERLSRMASSGLLLTAGGTWLMLSNDLGGFTWQGAALILTASVLYTGYMLVSSVVTRGISAVTVSAHVSTGAAFVFLVLAVVTRQPLPEAGAYLAGAGIALCATIIAMITFFAGLPLVGPTRASIISMLEPVFTTLLAVLLLHEHLTPLQTVGIALVVVGAVAAQYKDRAQPKPQEA